VLGVGESILKFDTELFHWDWMLLEGNKAKVKIHLAAVLLRVNISSEVDSERLP
jgi:hypothetical protein